MTFYTSDGNKKIEVSVANINIVDGALSVIDITEENNLKLYPNPANTHIYVPQNLSNKSFKVLDMKGRKILDIKSDNVGRLNIDFLSTGTYYLINETRIGKFVKK